MENSEVTFTVPVRMLKSNFDFLTNGGTFGGGGWAMSLKDNGDGTYSTVWTHIEPEVES